MDGGEEELGFEPVFSHKGYPYNPKHIRYTQDSINPAFKNGKSLEVTCYLLRNKEIPLSSIPNIRVFVRDKKVYSLDNRRLWVLKKLGLEEIPIDVVKYDSRFDSKITTTSDGQRIYWRKFRASDDGEEQNLDSREVASLFKKTILSWSKEDIMNDDKFKGRLPLLPEIFESPAHYFHLFKPHVLEEVRAQMKQSIEGNCEGVPWAEIFVTSCFRKQDDLFEVHASIVRLQPEDHKLEKANDVLFITDRPNSEAVYRGLSIYKEGALRAIAFNVVNFQHKSGDRLFVYWTANITTSIRVNFALRNKGFQKFINQMVNPFENHYDEDPNPTAIPLKLNQYIKEKFNLSQQQAIRSITASTSSGNGIVLLQGPPGTGKTATIYGALNVLVVRGVRTLVCSSSNHAVDDIARKVVNNGFIGEDGSKSRPFVVLVGNEDNIDLSGGLEEIFIDNLVKEMHNVKGKLIGALEKLGGFFESPANYELYIKTESKDKQKNQKGKAQIPHIIDFISKAISGFSADLQLWLVDAQATLLPTTFGQYKPTIENMIKSLKEIAPLLSSLASDLIAPGMLVKYLLDGLPIAMPRNVPLGIRMFIELWQKVVAGERLLRAANNRFFLLLEEEIIKQASIIFCTVSTCGSFIMRKTRFEIGIVDEAGQCVEAETLLALNLITKRCVLVGDPRQLPSTVISQESKRLHYDRSMMDRFMESRHPFHLLDTQYRMHPDISAFPNERFYESRIRNGEPVMLPNHGGKWHSHPLFPTYAFFDIKGLEEKNTITGSVFNSHEVNAIGHVLSNLFHSYPDTSHANIGVITPYKEQLKRIDKQLRELFPAKKILVATVDGFQGREMDIIILSAVRANWNNSLGFVKDFHRLNVAITRARYSLWIIGHSETLSHDANWKVLIQNAKTRNRLFSQDYHKISIDAKIAVTHAIESIEKPKTTKRRPLFEDAPWQVILSNRACDSIRRMIEKKQDVKKLFERLLWIAQGNRPTNYYLSCPCSDFVRDMLYEYKMNSGQTILWTVDVDRYQQKQILKVWDILPMPDRIMEAVKRIERALNTYSQKFIDLCKMKLEEEGVILPLKFNEEDLDAIPTLSGIKNNNVADLVVIIQPEKAAVEESFLLMKFFPLSSHLARMLAVGNDIEIPFQLSPEETELVKFPMASLFILGRSGTGKTTVLVFRMFSIQQAYQNSVLAEIAHQIDTNSEETVTESNNEFENTKSNVVKQLFVTASPKLCASITDYYKKLHVAIKPDNTLNKNASLDDDMLDEDEEAAILSNVPDSFALVTEADCPLILTFTKLLAMVDNSFPTPFLKDRDSNSLWSAEGGDLGSVKKENSETYSNKVDIKPKRKEVDFPRFEAIYYSHFDQRITSLVDASTVFLQIMSFIKGSAEAMRTQKGHLSLGEYLAYPPKKCPLPQTKKELVYKLFEKYESMKVTCNDYDQCDFVFYVIKQLRNNEVLPVVAMPKVNFVYIDEVQDLTQAQLLLFSYICDNLKGFVFAGDTAQTIARGVGFRFEDIRSLYYTEFAQGKETVPDLHHLTQNFRTHSGICNMASSVVEPLLRFFPESIDKLKRETALVAGDCPIFLQIQGFKEIFFHMFREGNKQRVEFGAEQAIIVRDQAAKEKLLTQITSGLVLTIYESKGLEFKSVLLYNFWHDSPAQNTWRVIYQFMAENKIGSPENYPEFSNEKFSALCNELKQLYVGVTRTRQDLFIFDEDEKTHQPMKDYWNALGNISTVKTMDHPAIANLAQKSDPEKWQSEGKKYFSSRNYELALRCFINSGNKYYELWTKASIIRGEGERLLNVDKTEESKAKFREAAELYLQAHVHPEKDTEKKLNVFAANLFVRCNEHTKAGEIFFGEGEFEKAGDCFRTAKRFDKAAHAFVKANQLDVSLDCCSAGKLYELGRDLYLQFRKQAVGTSFAEKVYTFLRAGALHYHAASDKERTLTFVHLFEPTSQRRKFLERYGYVDELVKVELAEGNYSKAGDIYLSHGKYEEASNSYAKGKDMTKAASCLVKQAKVLDLLTEVVTLNANAASFTPQNTQNTQNNNRNNKRNNRNNKPAPQYQVKNNNNNNTLAVKKQSMDLLEKAKVLVADDVSTHTSFEVELILAVKQNDTPKLETLLLVAKEKGYAADELDILLRVCPSHISNQSFSINQVVEEGKRVRSLGLEMLNALSAAELNRPYQAVKMQIVEDFFQVQSHPNPEMRIIQRVDWLARTDYKSTVGKEGQMEVRRDVFLTKAIAFLGRKVVSTIMAVVDRYHAHLFNSATDHSAKILAIFETMNFGKEINNILNMTHLHFNVTLTDLNAQFQQTLASYLKKFSLLYYPPERTMKPPTYLANKQDLETAVASITQNLIELCCTILFSPVVRNLDALCISLLADLKHNLYLNIYNFNLQKPLFDYLHSHRCGHLVNCSKSGVRYLASIVNYNNFMAPGLPPSQGVWILENLVTYNLAYYSNFNVLILPKSLALDCMTGQEPLYHTCLSYRNRNAPRNLLSLPELWNLLKSILSGKLYGWFQCFNYEATKSQALVNRLLQLMFIIRVNAYHEYSYELYEFLEDFNRYYSMNYSSPLSIEWQSVIKSQIKGYRSTTSCEDFVSMLYRLGEPCVIVTKYSNNFQPPTWAKFIPHICVSPQRGKLDFSTLSMAATPVKPSEQQIEQKTQETKEDQSNVEQQEGDEPEEGEEGLLDESMTEEKEEEKEEDSKEVKEARYYNNMKPSLKYKMLRWLKLVRRRMYNLSIHEKYQIEARTILNSKANVDQAYVDFYCEHVCLLREQLVAAYESLNTTMANLKELNLSDGEAELLDKGLDAVDDTQEALEVLDIKNPHHESFSLEWLQEQVQQRERVLATISNLEATVQALSL